MNLHPLSAIFGAVAGARNAGISMVVRLFADWSGAAVPVARPDAASRTTDKNEES